LLDRQSSVPLYLQVKQWLIQQMETGVWKEGDLLKPERELAEEFGVHRLTVRQALSELVSEGRVVRIRGRGTFVASPKIRQTLQRLTSFSEDMRMLGMEPGSRVLKMEIREASHAECEKLSLKDEDLVIELRRLRLADGTPMAVETAVLPYVLCRQLTELPFGSLTSLYTALRNTCGIELRRAEQTIEASLASSKLARSLQIKEGMPVLKMNRKTYSSSGIPVEWVTSFYRADRYTFRVDLLV
jgi:GntR family transcriptional regulator